jgi:16S rRNA U1498 N3-methylase RsmE
MEVQVCYLTQDLVELGASLLVALALWVCLVEIHFSKIQLDAWQKIASDWRRQSLADRAFPGAWYWRDKREDERFN